MKIEAKKSDPRREKISRLSQKTDQPKLSGEDGSEV
jgi:hypothetical protein